MTTHIPTKDVAKLTAQHSKANLPGVPFCVGCARSAASSWIDVSYTDGPDAANVKPIIRAFERRTVNGQTDSYDDNGHTLKL